MLVGCGNSGTSSIERVYSFSGESNELRVINGVAVFGGENETFYGGKLEIKDGGFQNATEYDMKFYISDGIEIHTILSVTSVDKTGDTLEVQNQEIGQITGPVFTGNISTIKDHLYFELLISYESGNTKKYTVPMEVTEVTATK